MRIVIKLGSCIITSKGGVDRERIKQIADQICRLPHDFAIVTSGAISTGMKKLGIVEKPQDVTMQQVLAAVGQTSLVNEYEMAFDHRKMVAQVLLTNYDFSDRMKYLNVQNTLLTLMRKGIVPIINENDTVTVGDIKKIAFRDNDSLSAHVAVSIYADILIIFTDVNGLYTKNPKEPGAELVKIIKEITDAEFEMCKGGNAAGRGGMVSKIRAAKMAGEVGIKVVIANGSEENAIVKVLNGEIGTTILPMHKINPKKYWIAFASTPKGKIFINEGAENAIIHEKGSLLSQGVSKSEGNFDKGDVVEILNQKGEVIAKGITNYFSTEIPRIIGLSEDEIFNSLGYAYREAVPRASMVVMDGVNGGNGKNGSGKFKTG